MADKILADLRARSDALAVFDVKPTLAIVKVGNDPSAEAYQRGAAKRCAQANVDAWLIALPETASTEDISLELANLSQNDQIHGILLLQPLPKEVDTTAVLRCIAPEKDVDGVTSGSLGGVFSGRGAGFAPCTAEACLAILKHYDIPVAGRRAVILGRSLVVGRPAAMLLLGVDATVTICHSKTPDGPELARQAHILIAATGVPHSITAGYFAPGQTVIDVGIHQTEGGLCGDADFDAAEKTAGAVSPVPGGVGSVTSAILARHVIEAAETALGLTLAQPGENDEADAAFQSFAMGFPG